MLPLEISDEENLYRGITKQPQLWKMAQDRPSSAAFKDSKGVSVDREGYRGEAELVDSLNSRFELRAIVFVNAGYCRRIETSPIAKPLDDNPYHAEIHNIDRVELTASKAKKLARGCVVVTKYDS